MAPNGNRIVVYKGPGQVAVETVDYPKLEVPQDVASAMGMSRNADHAVILRNVSTNICGSDQHMVRGRTTAPAGQTLGHEITGEIIEKGSDVQFLEVGDICSVPFNIACGRCRNCHEGQTGVCLNVNPARAGSAYGYVDMGGWLGGQAEYVMVPFADFNLLKFPDRDQALEKIRDLTMLSDIFPTGYHGCYTAGVTTGSTVYIAGTGPVGLAAAHSAQLLGAAVVIVGDLNKERLQQARSFGCETVDISDATPLDEQIRASSASPRSTAPSTPSASKPPRTVAAGGGRGDRAQLRHDRRPGGRQLGIPGLYVTGDPGAADDEEKEGTVKVRLGLGWPRATVS
jgi:glutathione-independent formaldehyde dehydrogenase